MCPSQSCLKGDQCIVEGASFRCECTPVFVDTCDQSKHATLINGAIGLLTESLIWELNIILYEVKGIS